MMEPSLGQQQSPMQGPLILAVDDSEIALAMVKAILREFGLTNVVTFTNSAEALDQLRLGAVEPDLILLDVMMPEINGIDLCAEIRCTEGKEDVPIIMLTSLEDRRTLSRAFLAGANDYVTKPFEPIELEARIKNGLRLGSELRRRKSSEARLMAESHSRSASVNEVGEIANDLLVSRSIFETAIRGLSLADLERVCFIVLALRRKRQSTVRGVLEEPKLLARTLGRVDLPANSLLARIDANLYCILAIDMSEDTARRVEHKLSTAVEATSFADPLDPLGNQLMLRVTTVRPGVKYPASAALADGIRTVGAPGENS